MTASTEIIHSYHQRSKHSLQQYAAGPGTLDWDAQPDPFRHFAGATQIPLPLLKQQLADIRYADLYRPGSITATACTLENIAALLERSLGLSAWKQYGTSRWSLRCNPSSGNLHPTEAYIVQGGRPDLPAGVYHYRSDQHSLERRCVYEQSASTPILDNRFLLGLSSVHWREAWKYGERAWRYVQLDVGHAIAGIRYVSALLGWQVQRLDTVTDPQLSQLLGLDRTDDFTDAEAEHPDVLLTIGPQARAADVGPMIKTLLDQGLAGQWQGQANLLDPKPLYEWPAIDVVSAAAERQVSAVTGEPQIEALPDLEISVADEISASELFKQRRSAQAFDGETGISLAGFYAMLDKLLPRQGIPPWDCLPHQARVHPVLFVHRVEGLAKGVYALPRHASALPLLQDKMRTEFKWEKPAGCPAHLPLYLLIAANCQNAARTIACHQDIAADSAFSLAMLAEYDNAVSTASWQYRDLYWEAGMLGQVLYLEAEANKLRGTGIGCFFDDSLHDTLGITDTSLQDVYHFTLGKPIVDNRLISLPPYGHLQGR